MVVDMSPAVRPVQAIKAAFRAFAIQRDADVGSGQRRAERDRVRVEITVAMLHGVDLAKMKTCGIFLLKFYRGDPGVIANGYIGHRVVKCRLAVSAQVVLDDGRLAAAIRDND